MFTSALLESDLKSHFEMVHLDISDRRGIGNLGKFDLMNMVLSLFHGIKFCCLLIRHNPRLVYLPISENIAGFMRDCLFILPAILMRKKIVIHFHGGYFRTFYENSNRTLKFFIRSIFHQVTCCIVLCHYYKDQLISILPKTRFEIIPYGIKDIGTNGKIKRAFPVSVLYLSNLIAEKGFLDVIKAAHSIVQKRTDVRFLFAGTWNGESEKQQAQEMIENFHLQNNIEFLGPVYGQKKLDLFTTCDIFVFPTYYRHESFGIVNLEAMAASLPIITTNKGCIRDLVIDHENGFIVEPQQPEQIAFAILQLIDNPDLRKRMGKAGRKKFEQYYTKEIHIHRMIEVFNKTLATNG
ncbi:MAG: glycosyltransferase family 4 protein [Chloroflexi bacterium]|nr:glycosyltransferase family 4 protein [Chloroflexota bacterium]